MTTLEELEEALVAEFDSAFDWADQVKDTELERWRVMYGFEPKDIRMFLVTALSRYKAGIAAEIEGMKKPETFIGTPCIDPELTARNHGHNAALQAVSDLLHGRSMDVKDAGSKGGKG